MDITPSRRFELTATLGQGGFGTVYRANSVGEGGFRKVVALKVLKREYVDHAEIVARLRDEARILSMLRHRAVTTVEDLLLLNGSWTLVMEFVDGVSLGALVRLGPVPVRPALEITQEIASVLHAAYTTVGPRGTPLRILHRDLKPPNVLLTSTGTVKVLDFGIARAEFDEREAETRSLGFGSPEYMAPERLVGDNGPEADIYALGAVLYELLVGERFGRTVISPEKMAARLEAATARILEIHGEAGRPAAELVSRCMQFEPERRPSAREVERACDEAVAAAPRPRLRDWAEERVPHVRATVTEQPMPQGDGTVLVEVQTGRAPERSGPGMGWVVGIAAVAVLAIGMAAFGAWALFALRQSRMDAAEALAAAEAARVAQQEQVEAQAARVAQEQAAAEAARVAQEQAAAATEPTPRRTSEATPEPSASRTSARTAASATTGAVSVDGEGAVTLVGGGHRYGLPATVPAGDYQIEVRFDGGEPIRSGAVSVPAGGAVSLLCKAAYQRCRVQ